MFKFDKEQVVFDFVGVKMGEQPGEYPTVLAGTIFHGGHNILNDELTGDFVEPPRPKRGRGFLNCFSLNGLI